MRISDCSSDVCSSDLVDKVGDPSEEQPNGRGAGDQVAQGQDREASLSREQPSRADHAQQAAMERHAAAPDHEYLKRIGKVPVEVVEEDVAQPAAQDDAEGRPQNEVAQVLEIGRAHVELQSLMRTP